MLQAVDVAYEVDSISFIVAALDVHVPCNSLTVRVLKGLGSTVGTLVVRLGAHSRSKSKSNGRIRLRLLFFPADADWISQL